MEDVEIFVSWMHIISDREASTRVRRESCVAVELRPLTFQIKILVGSITRLQRATKNTDWSSSCYHYILTKLRDGPIEQGGQTKQLDIRKWVLKQLTVFIFSLLIDTILLNNDFQRVRDLLLRSSCPVRRLELRHSTRKVLTAPWGLTRWQSFFCDVC